MTRVVRAGHHAAACQGRQPEMPRMSRGLLEHATARSCPLLDRPSNVREPIRIVPAASPRPAAIELVRRIGVPLRERGLTVLVDPFLRNAAKNGRPSHARPLINYRSRASPVWTAVYGLSRARYSTPPDWPGCRPDAGQIAGIVPGARRTSAWPRP